MSHILKTKMEGNDRKLLSQELKVNFSMFDSLSKGLPKQNNLLTLHFINLKLAPRSWGNLGNALGENKTILNV